jgi:aquaporin NIP
MQKNQKKLVVSRDAVQNRTMVKRLTGEFLATFGLVFCGTGAIIINEESTGIVTHVGIACTFGCIVMAMILSFGHISGAHMNPAVSIALCISGRFKKQHVIQYILIQIAAACLASLILHGLFNKNDLLGGTYPRGSEFQSFTLEFILSFLLMIVILLSTNNKDHTLLIPAIAIGAVVGLEALFAGPICGASMNPARSMGPAIVSGHYKSLWIYTTAPILGTISGSLICKLVLTDRINNEVQTV